MFLHCFLVPIVSEEKCAVIFYLCSTFHNESFFPLDALKTFSFLYLLNILIIVCLGVVVCFLCLGFIELLGCGYTVCIKYGKFSAIIFVNIFCVHLPSASSNI